MTRTRHQRDLERAATHEAGHAVIGFVLGIKVHRISIEQQGSSAGHVYIRSLGHQRSAVYALAGHAAEEQLLDVPFVSQLFDHEAGDLQDALLILTDRHGREISLHDPEFAEAWSRAQAACRAASRRIRAVALVLFDVRVVDGEERVRRLLEGRGTAWYGRAVNACKGR